MNIMNGLATASEIREELRRQISTTLGRPPRLDVILIGEYAPSMIYVNSKRRACAEVGITSELHQFEENISQEMLLKVIQFLNQDPLIDGILVQFPLPAHIDLNTVMSAIAPHKDVDGFHPINRGKLFLGDADALVPCTPLGICELLKRYQVSTVGKKVTIVGRSNIVGKPLAILLMQPHTMGNATVTVAHSLTANLTEVCQQADILIAAMGKKHAISPQMVKEGAVVIDVGMNALESDMESKKRRVVGDVDFENVKDKCHLITPVPGGVGPMTIAMLLSNTFKAYQMQSAYADSKNHS